uniref:Tub domain-containing protein n=1 Tax=Macrostomum lignano TaxID=282301 RepID=A0A1I8FMJ1_9PLAT
APVVAAAASSAPATIGRPDAAASAAGRLLDGLEARTNSDVREFHRRSPQRVAAVRQIRRSGIRFRGRRLLDRDGAGSPGAVGSTDTSVPGDGCGLPARQSSISSKQPRLLSKPELHREALVEEILPRRRRRSAPAPVRNQGNATDTASPRGQSGPETGWCGKRLVREAGHTGHELRLRCCAGPRAEGCRRVHTVIIVHKAHFSRQNLRIHFRQLDGPQFSPAAAVSAPLEEDYQAVNTFGSVLHRIKCAYDDYLAWLLDGTSRPAQHRHLRAQLDQLRDPAAESELGRLQDRLAQLESRTPSWPWPRLSDSRGRRRWLRRSATGWPKKQLELAAEEQRLRSGGGRRLQEETSADRCERCSAQRDLAGLDSLAELRHDFARQPIAAGLRRSPIGALLPAGARRDADSGGGARQAGQANQAGVDRLAAAYGPGNSQIVLVEQATARGSIRWDYSPPPSPGRRSGSSPGPVQRQAPTANRAWTAELRLAELQCGFSQRTMTALNGTVWYDIGYCYNPGAFVCPAVSPAAERQCKLRRSKPSSGLSNYVVPSRPEAPRRCCVAGRSVRHRLLRRRRCRIASAVPTHPPPLRPRSFDQLLLQARLPLLRLQGSSSRCSFRLRLLACSFRWLALTAAASDSSTRCSVPVLRRAAALQARATACSSVLRLFSSRRYAAPSVLVTAASTRTAGLIASTAALLARPTAALLTRPTAGPVDSSTGAAPSGSSTAATSDLVHTLFRVRFIRPPLLSVTDRLLLPIHRPPLLHGSSTPLFLLVTDCSCRVVAAALLLVRPPLLLSRRRADPSESSDRLIRPSLRPPCIRPSRQTVILSESSTTSTTLEVDTTSSSAKAPHDATAVYRADSTDQRVPADRAEGDTVVTSIISFGDIFLCNAVAQSYVTCAVSRRCSYPDGHSRTRRYAGQRPHIHSHLARDVAAFERRCTDRTGAALTGAELTQSQSGGSVEFQPGGAAGLGSHRSTRQARQPQQKASWTLLEQLRMIKYSRMHCMPTVALRARMRSCNCHPEKHVLTLRLKYSV